MLRPLGLPLTESTMLIHRPHPFVEKSTLGFVFLGWLTLSFENEMLAALEFDDEIGTILFHHAFEDVDNLKPEMVVLHPGIDIGVSVKLKRLRVFPSAVVDTEVNVRSFRSLAGTGCVPRLHVARGSYWLFGIKDRLN